VASTSRPATSQLAEPLDWTFIRHDLDAVLARLADRERHLRLEA
jgi:hypothetical protein